jgi:hypothetical protein
MNLDNNIILFEKNGLKFYKISTEHYKIEYSLENNNIILSKIIDFTLIELLYTLNKDIYENFDCEKIDQSTVKIITVVNHLFQELGLPQYFSNLLIKKEIYDNKIIFNGMSIYKKPEFIDKMAQQIPLHNLIITCSIMNNHNIDCVVDIFLEKKNPNLPLYIENIVLMILTKIFNRLKQFIENVSM